jgi:hypothetical protein
MREPAIRACPRAGQPFGVPSELFRTARAAYMQDVPDGRMAQPARSTGG